jgi:hypothetical protein
MTDSFKELEDFKSVSVDNDEKGYTDKQCPSEECEFFLAY